MITAFFNRRFEQWLNRRMPATKQITLGSGNLFIFPSKAGGQLLLCCFILFLLGTNYQNNLILFMVFFLCSFMLTCLLLSYRNLAKLTLKAVDSEAQFAGQDCQFRLRLSFANEKAQDLFFAFQHAESELQATLEEETIVLFSTAKQRGYFNPGRITLRSRFPFGLYNVWTHIDFGFQVLIYPQPIENKMKPSLFSENSMDKSSTKQRPGVDQFSTLKSYQSGESLKSVAWKQLAQGRGWLSKQFEQSAAGEQLFDIATLNHLPLETRLSYLCFQILQCEKKGQRYALTLVDQKIGLGSGTTHKQICLQALALFNSASDCQ